MCDDDDDDDTHTTITNTINTTTIPTVNSYFPYTLLNKVIRDKEKTQLSGTSYFSLGCTLVISLFPKNIAEVSICYLVLGDMIAALFGEYYYYL